MPGPPPATVPEGHPPSLPAAGQLSAPREGHRALGLLCKGPRGTGPLGPMSPCRTAALGPVQERGDSWQRQACQGRAPTKCVPPSPRELVSAAGWVHFPRPVSVVRDPWVSVTDLDRTASCACETRGAGLNHFYYGGCRMVCRWFF